MNKPAKVAHIAFFILWAPVVVAQTMIQDLKDLWNELG